MNTLSDQGRGLALHVRCVWNWADTGGTPQMSVDFCINLKPTIPPTEPGPPRLSENKPAHWRKLKLPVCPRESAHQIGLGYLQNILSAFVAVLLSFRDYVSGFPFFFRSALPIRFVFCE